MVLSIVELISQSFKIHITANGWIYKNADGVKGRGCRYGWEYEKAVAMVGEIHIDTE